MLLGKGVRKIPGAIVDVFSLKKKMKEETLHIFTNFDDLGKKF